MVRRHTSANAGILTIASLLLVGCSAVNSADTTTQSQAPVGIQHVHALVVDQGSGQLFVASHEGLYQLSIRDDGATDAEGPVGGLDFDPMGFTLDSNSGIAYASGHPGPTTPSGFGNPNLGLIASADRGRTWTNVSLTGETDFHALAVAQTTDGGATWIYGIDPSQQAVRRSSDAGVTWTDGASLIARDLLADPTDPATLYATTEDGLAISQDNAGSFHVDPEAPPLYLIAVDKATGDLAGIDTEGAVWQRDRDNVWAQGGSVSGMPQAFTISEGRVYVFDDRGLAFSDNLGRDWTRIAI